MSVNTFISIIMLTHNAPSFVKRAVITLRKMTSFIDYELIVFDNCSNPSTRVTLNALEKDGFIDKLIYNNHNLLFAGGNNEAVKYAKDKATHLLLLNSDIEFRNPKWLSNLLFEHKYGISSYGVCETPPHHRVDGYCLLIDKELYEKFQLDETFPWFYSITKLQAQVLTEGGIVKGYKNHNGLIYHYGGASGTVNIDNKINQKTVDDWFGGLEVRIIDLYHNRVNLLKIDYKLLFYSNFSRFRKKMYRLLHNCQLPK